MRLSVGSGRYGPGVGQTLSDWPDLAAEWHPVYNGEWLPAFVPARSNKTAWWRCKRGHDYQARVANRVALGRGCPYCANRRVGYGNDLASVCPGLAAQWHPTRNGALTASQVVPGSGRKVWWLCPAGHHYDAAVCKRTREGTGCPYCAGHRTGQGNDLATMRPDLAAQWHTTRNRTLTPAHVAPGSGRKAWWRCPAGHEYDAAVFKRVAGSGCPYCAGKRVGFGNDLATLHPAIAAQWHPTRNGAITPHSVTSVSNRLVWWRCEQGHEFDATIRSRARKQSRCPYCAGHRVGYGNDFAALHPRLAVEWHPTRNAPLDPGTIRPQSHRNVWWQCARCAHEWQAVVASRVNGRGCPRCAGDLISRARRRPEPGGSLAQARPDIAAEWHPTRNGTMTPGQVSWGSSDKVWWQCPRLHAWRAVISTRTRATGSSGCPYCAGQRATADNNLAVCDPYLAAQWHPDRNSTLTPDKVTPKSHRAVWWRCRKQHEWRAVVASRTAGRGCPYCANIKVGYGNDLATRFPIIAAEWHPSRNGALAPSLVLPGTDRKVWWQCPRGHEWCTTVDSRTGRGSGCPECYLLATSKLEIRIFAELAHVLSAHTHPVEHNPYLAAPPGRKLAVDMRFGPVVVEYDGAYWHSESNTADAAKSTRLEKAGYRVLRIREQPLTLLSEHDVSAPTNQPPHQTAAAVLAALLQRGWVPDTASPAINTYLAAGAAVAEQAALTIIDKRRQLPVAVPAKPT